MKGRIAQSLAVFRQFYQADTYWKKLVRNDIYSSTKGMRNPAILRGAGRRYCAPERSHLANVRIRGCSSDALTLRGMVGVLYVFVGLQHFAFIVRFEKKCPM